MLPVIFKSKGWPVGLIALPLGLAVLTAACGGGPEPNLPPTVEPAASVGEASEGVASGRTATPLSASTPTVIPQPTATPVSVFDLEIDLGNDADPLAEDAFERLEALTDQFSPRASATEEESAAADYLVGEFEALGYAVSLQPFSFEFLAADTPVLAVDSQDFTDLQAIPLSRSGTGQFSGNLAFVGKGFEADLPAEGLQGKVALMERGVITFSEKVARVTEAGAVAAVVFNDRREAFSGRLLEAASIPAVAISGDLGRALRDAIANVPIEATVSVVYETRESRNVIAEKPGTDDDGRVVVLGGHYDTVPGAPGANDNGSGIVTLLTVAQQVEDTSYPFAVRFISFGAEELGLFGSRHYVDTLGPEERSNVVAMLNFDALATGPSATVVGTDDLVDRVLEAGRAGRVPVERAAELDPGTSSDHAPFEAVDIPVVFFSAEDYSRIHTPEDTLDFVQPSLMGDSAALAIALLDSLAKR